jgi:hypothetical protein
MPGDREERYEAVWNVHALRLIIPAMRINCKLVFWASSDPDAVRFVDLRWFAT